MHVTHFSHPQVLLLFLDWVSTHKVTDAAAQTVWGLLTACCPVGEDLPTFWAVKRMLQKSESRVVQRIDICQNDCIAYYNTRHLPAGVASRNAHRTHCPECNAKRYIDDPVTGTKQAVKVVYHFPMAPFVRGLYARPDLVPHLFHDCGNQPPGHITRSRGFRRKVTDNAHINGYGPSSIFVLHVYIVAYTSYIFVYIFSGCLQFVYKPVHILSDCLHNVYNLFT